MTQSASMSVVPSGPLAGLSRYIYGTTRLGDGGIPVAERVKIARAAMDAGVWFHTSHQYGDALRVLRMAFDEDRARVPRMIFKIGWSSIAEIRDQIRLQLEVVGVDRMDMGQLCLGAPLAEELATGGKCYEGFRRLKEEGLVRHFVVEVFPWTAQKPLEALRSGHLQHSGVIDGFIFYLNPLQRFASNELWDLIREQNQPVIALRTVSGGDVHRLRDVPGAAWKDYLRQRAVEVAPVYERSGCASWAEFCVRFAFGFPQVQATVGATSRVENLRILLEQVRDPKPLPADIQSQIVRLQYRWSDETDVRAEPWSM